jgi:hypothetical protein
MEIIVIIEPFGTGYRARCSHPLPAEAKGETAFEARLALEKKPEEMVSESFSIFPVGVTPDKPWLATAGSVPDDPTTDEWLAAIEQYRRDRDAEDRAAVP